jgi:hypothetical protein
MYLSSHFTTFSFGVCHHLQRRIFVVLLRTVHTNLTTVVFSQINSRTQKRTLAYGHPIHFEVAFIKFKRVSCVTPWSYSTFTDFSIESNDISPPDENFATVARAIISSKSRVLSVNLERASTDPPEKIFAHQRLDFLH